MPRSTEDIKNAPRDAKISLALKFFPNARAKNGKVVMGSTAGEEGQSLSYNPDTDYYKDFAHPEHKGGNLAKLISMNMGISYGQALKLVRHELGLPIPKSRFNTREVVRAAPIPVPDNAPPPAIALGTPHYSNEGFAVTAIYRYVGADRRLMFLVCRFEGPILPKKGKPEKLVLPYTYREQGGWQWKGPGLPQTPLYGLDRLAARPDDYVLVLEGEKAADAAALLFPNFVPITWMGGIGQLGKADFSPLMGRNIMYWPDNDDPGMRSVPVLAQRLTEIGVAKFRVVNLPPNLPQGWDVADEAPPGLDFVKLLDDAAESSDHIRILFRDLSFEDLLKRLAYNVETDQFVDLLTGQRLRPQQLNNLFCHSGIRNMAVKLLADCRLRKVQRFAYIPSDENKIVRVENDLLVLNLWRPSTVVRQAGDVTPFIEHLRYLCSTDEEFDHLEPFPFRLAHRHRIQQQ